MNDSNSIQQAVSKLVLAQPFYGAAVLRKPMVPDAETETASVNAIGEISYNPDFVASLSVNQLVFLMAHECLHYMLGHHKRAFKLKDDDARLWNSACDAVINETLIRDRVGLFIEGGVRYHGAADMSAEEVYAAMKSAGFQPPPSGGGIGDDLDTAPPKDGDGRTLSPADVESQRKRDLVGARSSAKRAGNLPAGLARMVQEQVQQTPVPWHQVLADYLTQLVPADYSWARPNRRHIADGLYLPGVDRMPQLGTVAIAIDTSGSVTPTELAHFEAHTNDVLEACNPEKVVVIYCDHRVQAVDEYTQDDMPIRFRNPKGGGGTAFDPVFDWVEAQDIEPDVLVYMTDMAGRQPVEPPYPVVWAATADAEPWFGKQVRIRL